MIKSKKFLEAVASKGKHTFTLRECEMDDIENAVNIFKEKNVVLNLCTGFKISSEAEIII